MYVLLSSTRTVEPAPQMAPMIPTLLVFTALYSPLSHCTTAGLGDHKNTDCISDSMSLPMLGYKRHCDFCFSRCTHPFWITHSEGSQLPWWNGQCSFTGLANNHKNELGNGFTNPQSWLEMTVDPDNSLTATSRDPKLETPSSTVHRLLTLSLLF